ncbi:MAG: hypothetical protein KGQ52_13490 [Alphaproteobacteria bacterium]|nr:hypothetical protein [Alphaproteobacteria bacterium]
MTPDLATALAGPRLTLFVAVELVLPTRTVRLLDGNGRLTLFGNSFAGRDAVFGTLGLIEELEEGGGDDAPALSLDLNPPAETAPATLRDPAMQGSPVRIWMGCVDGGTGAVVPDPDLVGQFMVDVAVLTFSEKGRRLSLQLVSALESAFDTDRGNSLSNSFHQSVWPGELGLEYVTGVAQRIYWGQRAPSPPISGAGGDAFRRPGDLSERNLLD